MVFPTSGAWRSRPSSLEGAPGPAEVPGVFAGHQLCRPASELMWDMNMILVGFIMFHHGAIYG